MEKGEKNLVDILYVNQSLEMPYLHKVNVMIQITNGVFYLHDMKVAHHDLKPQNVVIVDFEMDKKKNSYIYVKLIDFGISKAKMNGNGRKKKKNKKFVIWLLK